MSHTLLHFLAIILVKDGHEPNYSTAHARESMLDFTSKLYELTTYNYLRLEDLHIKVKCSMVYDITHCLFIMLK